MNPLQGVHDAPTLAQAIVNTIHEPFLVMDEDLRVLSASRSFYEIFRVDPEQTQGCMLYALGEGQWDIPALRTLLETIIPEKAEMDDFEVDYDFPGVGRRTMLLNARKVIYQSSPSINILLAFTDVTSRRAAERDKTLLLETAEALARDKQVLLQEMEHRIANSLQIIASILMLKARAVASEETRLHLTDAHQRVMSVAAVQSHLHASDGLDEIAVGSYMTKLCGSLATSMIGESHPISLEVMAGEGSVGSAQAVSMGLIVTELVINALKYAFPTRKAGARIVVSYEAGGDDWKLMVSDNGIGKPMAATAPASGLGTLIVKALVKQLGGSLHIDSTPAGRCVTVTRASFGSAPTAPTPAY